MRIQTTDTNHRDLGQQEAKVYSNLGDSAPYRVDYDGREYWSTGKEGISFADGKEMTEMATEDDQRLWIANDESRIELD